MTDDQEMMLDTIQEPPPHVTQWVENFQFPINGGRDIMAMNIPIDLSRQDAQRLQKFFEAWVQS